MKKKHIEYGRLHQEIQLIFRNSKKLIRYLNSDIHVVTV